MTDVQSRSQIIQDEMDPARARALHTTLGRGEGIGEPNALPPFFHHAYFWDPQPDDALGRDGHPRVGGVIPDLGLPRRMWAGGRLRFEIPLRTGQSATRTTTVISAVHKQGRTGPLGFVTLAHDITQNGHLCVREKQDLVYREDAKLGGQLPRHQDAPENEEFAKSMCFSTTTLFRYSALTFNGHRIHYDFDYARNVEGYDGLVVHGPLLAQHLILLAVDRLGPLTGFDFRAISPLIHTETADFCVKGNTLWVRASDGRLCLRAEAIPH